jgi:energy-coupling factor transporter ATP-binding protein EcfA2
VGVRLRRAATPRPVTSARIGRVRGPSDLRSTPAITGSQYPRPTCGRESSAWPRPHQRPQPTTRSATTPSPPRATTARARRRLWRRLRQLRRRAGRPGRLVPGPPRCDRRPHRPVRVGQEHPAPLPEPADRPPEGCRVEGDVRYRGLDLYARSVDPVAVRARIGMVFQRPNPFPKSIFANVAFGPCTVGFHGDINEIVEQALRRAALWDEVTDRLHESALALSGGQQQRLVIARCLAVDPATTSSRPAASPASPPSSPPSPTAAAPSSAGSSSSGERSRSSRARRTSAPRRTSPVASADPPRPATSGLDPPSPRWRTSPRGRGVRRPRTRPSSAYG